MNEDIQAFLRGDFIDFNTDAIEFLAKDRGMLTLEQKVYEQH